MVVLAKTRGKTYKLGRKSSGSIIVANKFTQGTGKSSITGGDDHNSLNAVFVGVGSGGVVEIFHVGPHDVIVTDALPNEVQFYRDSDDKICLKDSQQRDLIKGWSTGNCKRLIFKKSENTQIIVNCQEYISGRIYSFVQENPIIVSYGADKQLKLNLPFKKTDATIDFYYPYNPRGKFLWVFFTEPYPPISYSAVRQPYLLIPAGYTYPTKLDAHMLANAIRFQFKAGIQFSDELVKDDAICPFVIEKFKSSPPRGYELTNLDKEC